MLLLCALLVFARALSSVGSEKHSSARCEKRLRKACENTEKAHQQHTSKIETTPPKTYANRKSVASIARAHDDGVARSAPQEH